MSYHEPNIGDVLQDMPSSEQLSIVIERLDKIIELLEKKHEAS